MKIRDAITGRWTSKAQAKANPSTTVVETERACKGVLTLLDGEYPCDLFGKRHVGAHSSQAAQAYWL